MLLAVYALIAARMEEELRTTAAQLVVVRRERIRKLYEEEREGYTKELASMGLAFADD